MQFRRGNAAIVLVLVFAVILVVGGFFVFRASQNVYKKTAALERESSGKRPLTTVSTNSSQASYQNPFEAKTQAENPFDSYENPFDYVQ